MLKRRLLQTSNKQGFALFESPNWSLLVNPESELNGKTRQFFADTVDTSRLVKRKSPKADIKLQHKKVYELSLAISLALLIATFQLGSQHTPAPASISQADIKIEVVDIPATWQRQHQKPPPPARPSVPVPSVGEFIPEDLTIATTEIDFSDIPPPPAPGLEDGEVSFFVEYDKPPKLIGGFTELQKHLKYPKQAWNLGIKGVVFVRVLVGVDGRAEKMEIIKAKPANMGFENACMAAMWKVRWEPAEQRENKIRAWVSIPVRFDLSLS